MVGGRQSAAESGGRVKYEWRMWRYPYTQPEHASGVKQVTITRGGPCTFEEVKIVERMLHLFYGHVEIPSGWYDFETGAAIYFEVGNCFTSRIIP